MGCYFGVFITTQGTRIETWGRTVPEMIQKAKSRARGAKIKKTTVVYQENDKT